MLPAPEPARAIRSRRVARCDGCRLPLALCLCAELPRLAIRTRLVVVMHRREAITSTNTGRLAAAMLEGARVRVRGARDATGAVTEPLPPGRRLALFPREGARVLGPEDASEATVLLVPDGTWAQARRLLLRDPELRAAEPVALPPVAPTRYALRRNRREGTVSTLEAIAGALGVLEGPEVEAALLAALDRFVERALRARTGDFPR
jgi:DTW domain-containing protein YfiP